MISRVISLLQVYVHNETFLAFQKCLLSCSEWTVFMSEMANTEKRFLEGELRLLNFEAKYLISVRDKAMGDLIKHM